MDSENKEVRLLNTDDIIQACKQSGLTVRRTMSLPHQTDTSFNLCGTVWLMPNELRGLSTKTVTITIARQPNYDMSWLDTAVLEVTNILSEQGRIIPPNLKTKRNPPPPPPRPYVKPLSDVMEEIRPTAPSNVELSSVKDWSSPIIAFSSAVTAISALTIAIGVLS